MVEPTMALSVTALAHELPSLHERALTLLTTRRPSPAELYLRIDRGVRASDLTSDAAADVRKAFNGFYGVRRNERWRYEFYRIFETAKGRPEAPTQLFRWSLGELGRATGRVEASFVSKLVATLHPEAPIIDSLIRAYLSRRIEAPAFGGDLAVAGAYFEWLSALFEQLSRTAQALEWCERFDDAFIDVPGATGIHPVKKVDFLIWAGSR